MLFFLCMRKYKNLTVIGTSHISIESVKEVENNILKIKPDVVALELDRLRFESLIYKRKKKFRLRDIKEVGFKGFLFNLLGSYIEKKLGKIVNVAPGSDMKKAVETAYKIKAKIALIDQDIKITLKNLSRKIDRKEKIKFFMDLIKALVGKGKVKFDLKKVPSSELVRKLTNKVKKEYPNVYKVLIEERNQVMGKYLYRLVQDYDKVVAVVGAGHEEDIIKEIKKWESLQKKR